MKLIEQPNFSQKNENQLSTTKYSQPQLLGSFSFDGMRNFNLNHQIPIYKEPRLGSNLLNGKELMIEKLYDIALTEGLFPILEFIKKQSLFRVLDDVEPVFISWRGVFNKFLLADAFRRNSESWKIAAFRCKDDPIYKNCIFLLDFEVRSNIGSSHPAAYMGFQFEKLCEDDNSIVNNNEETGIFLKSRLGKYRLVFGAEVDCRLKQPNELVENSLQLDTLIELKTVTYPATNSRYFYLMKDKFPHYWGQCYLAGIENIVIGFRLECGTLKSTQQYVVKDIPQMVKEYAVKNNQRLWNTSEMLSGAERIMDSIKTTFHDNPQSSQLLIIKDGRQIRIFEHEQEISLEDFERLRIMKTNLQNHLKIYS